MLEISVHREGKKVLDYKKTNSFKTFGVAGCLLAIPSKEEINKLLSNSDKVIEETNKALNDLGLSKNKGVNTQWLDNNLPSTPQIQIPDSNDLKAIADFCRTVKEFIEGVIWCLANPFTALFKFMVWIEPILLIICLVVASTGVLVYLLKMDKFLGKTPSQLTKNPILFYLLFKIILYSLSLVI